MAIESELKTQLYYLLAVCLWTIDLLNVSECICTHLWN